MWNKLLQYNDNGNIYGLMNHMLKVSRLLIREGHLTEKPYRIINTEETFEEVEKVKQYFKEVYELRRNRIDYDSGVPFFLIAVKWLESNEITVNEKLEL